MCLMLSYYSLRFKKTRTIILYKLNKKDYIVLKVYRLITLLNTLEKALEKLITSRFIIMIKKYNLLLEK